MNFRTFDGENPKLWITRCEDYFDMYAVEPALWIKVSSMHFTAAAARWLQSVEQNVRDMNWPHFCRLVLDRFGKDQHEMLIRQLFHISQSGSVSEYIEKFSGLVDQLLAYGRNQDPLFYAMRFVDGLKDDIKAAVHLQRPATLDTACVLALLQEELAEPGRKRDFHQHGVGFSSRTPFKGPLPLPLPPKPDKAIRFSSTAPADERKGRGIDDKLAALKAYRRARGLCVKCAEKWSRDHRCPDSIQLHVLQETWELCNLEESSYLESEEPSPELLLLSATLSCSVSSGVVASRTIQLWGTIQGKVALMLIDSGSSHTFIKTKLAEQLSGVSSLSPALTVKVADGKAVRCDSQLSGAIWSVQGHQFSSDFKVFPLAHYDVIIGMDWLEQFSPMRWIGYKSG